MSGNKNAGWLIRAGLLLDGTMDPPVRDAALIIREGRIVAVGSGQAVESQRVGDETIIDANSHTVMPGLFDCHHHLDQIDTPRIGTIERALQISLEYNCVLAARNAKIVLEAGITSMRDIGCRGNLAVGVRDAVNNGLIPGPRIVASGNILTTTAGLADFYPPWVVNNLGLGRVVNGEDEIRRAVREQIRAGVDNVKLEASGSVPPFTGPRLPSMTVEEIRVACEEAHKRGKIVAAHAEHLDAVKNALRGGVDTIEHGEYLDQEAIDLFLEHGAFLDATSTNLDNLRHRLEEAIAKEMPRSQIDALKLRYDGWMQGFQRAHEARVPIIAGSDTAPHGKNAVELENLVKAGLPPAEAIHSATQVSAQALKLESVVGTLSAGMHADLLIVDGDPLQDITLLQKAINLVLVMKGGEVVVDRRGLVRQ